MSQTVEEGIYLSTVRCAVKRTTSSRRRRQLHPASLYYAATSKCNEAIAERLHKRNETTSQASQNGVLVKSGFAA